MTRAVAVVSGGMDSVTALYYVRDLVEDVSQDLRMISFDYGQKHVKELDCAIYHAEVLGIRHDIIDLTSLSTLLSSSALVGKTDVPDGHYADETMKATVVPNRNMMMLSIAAAVAVNDKAKFIVAGMHAGDHPIYPDCRVEFVSSFNTTVGLATEGFAAEGMRVITPFLYEGKDEIVREGVRLGVDYQYTWSCYKGGNIHCGTCGTCVERKEAFELAGVTDPTQYAA